MAHSVCFTRHLATSNFAFATPSIICLHLVLLAATGTARLVFMQGIPFPGPHGQDLRPQLPFVLRLATEVHATLERVQPLPPLRFGLGSRQPSNLFSEPPDSRGIVDKQDKVTTVVHHAFKAELEVP